MLFFSLAASAPLLDGSDEGKKIHLQPHYFAGETLHYQFEIRSSSSGHTSSPVSNPEAAAQLDQSSTLLVRLDVLGVQPRAGGGTGPVRLRVTYEKVSVTGDTDAYDPSFDQNEQQLKSLEGHSLEFTLLPDGEVSGAPSSKNSADNNAGGADMRSLMAGFASGAGMPKDGIRPGEKWDSERPLENSPLSATVWRKHSTYMRNEPCPRGPNDSGGQPAKAAAAPETCAIILTNFEIVQTTNKGDQTPAAYRSQGLRTSGKWTGSGESLESISLRTGLVVATTQTSDQQMDFTIESTTAASRIAYSGHVRNRMQLMLMPEAELSKN